MTNTKYKRMRAMETRWTVKVADKIAKHTITIGGIGTILAVSSVFLFLVAVVVPIFMPGSAEDRGMLSVSWPADEILHVAVDEYKVMGWMMFRDGDVRAFRLDNGELLGEIQAVNGDSLSAWAFGAQGNDVAFGFSNGTIRPGKIGFETDFPSESVLPPAVGTLDVGDVATVDGAVLQRTLEGQLRRQRVVVEIDQPLPAVSNTAVVLLDHHRFEDGSLVCALTADAVVHLSVVEKFENLLSGEVEYDVNACHIKTDFEGAFPTKLIASESGTNVYLIWPDGTLLGYDTRDFDSPKLAIKTQLVNKGQAEITAFQMLLGGATLLAGDSEGRVSAWFQHFAHGDAIEAEQSPGTYEFSAAHRYAKADAAVTAIAPSARSRVFAVGYGNGRVRIYQATSEAKVIDTRIPDGQPIWRVAIAPKNDGLVALTSRGIHRWDVNLMHPEATLKSLFLPVWYEGYEEPSHVWQSSSGTDDFEPKFGLWPLVFGTLKATFYSLLFGVPLALLAALYTSEFMSPSVKPRVKTLIESMASLPSVVLGFLAALVFAPFVQRVVPAALVGFLVIPGSFLLAAYFWQLLPHDLSVRLSRFRLWILLALLPVGVFVSAKLGPWVENTLFERDIILWLDGQKGSGMGGWILMLLPVSAVGVVWLLSSPLSSQFGRMTNGASRTRVAFLDFGRFIFGAVLTLSVALVVSALLTLAGVDPRGQGAFMDTYVQRNALVVGFVMGFAIIPIIYTIAEDALSAVPDHLRAASLGAGATPWQTAIRIVLPTAMSGLFSAIMIGLGRAVGETMIVLMAAGNTPVLEMNIFNGFRTLSANIAVELPEAVRDSTHYRTLFLAALILFLMTFSVNTIAEMVRLRFRRRSSQI